VDDENTRTAAGADVNEIVIALVVRRASDPIEGTITLNDAAATPFTGWMQLTQLLSRALDAGP
jgi:hypothetical protein